MITAFRQCREYSSVPSCLIVSGTQKQKITLRSRENNFVLKREANTGGILELAGSTAPKQRNPFGESGKLCPKSERHPDDLSGRRSLQFVQ